MSPTATTASTRPGSNPTSRRKLPLAVVLGALLLTGLGVLLALNTASAAQELRQRALTQSNADTSDQQQQLLRDLAQKQSPTALASAAAALGLIPNSNPAFLKIDPNGSVTILGVPAPATRPPVPVAPKPTVKPTPTATPSVTPSAKPGTSATGAHPAVTVTVTATAPVPKPAVSKPAVSKPAASQPAGAKPSTTPIRPAVKPSATPTVSPR